MDSQPGLRCPNGSIPVFSPGPFNQLVAVLHCPCADGVARRVRRVSVPDTYWTAPGSVRVRGATVSGYVHSGSKGYTFIAAGKNAHLINKPAAILRVLRGE